MSRSREDTGQAIVVLIALLGLAALVVLSLGDANARVFSSLRAQRAAEAAAEAAGVVVSDRLVELREEALERRALVDVIAVALVEDALHLRAEAAAREVLAVLGAQLERLLLELRHDEISVRAEVRWQGARGVARVGVRAP